MDESENQNLEQEPSNDENIQPVNNTGKQGNDFASRQINAAKEAMQKAQKVIQGAAKKMLSKAFWAGAIPYIVPALITLVVIAVLILGIVIISRAYKGGFGKKPAEAANISQPEDRSLLDELAKYTGAAPQFDAKKIAELAQNINIRIDEGKLTFSDGAGAKIKIAKIIELCNGGKSDKVTTTKITKLISELIDLYWDNPARLSGSSFSPVGDQKISSFNNTLHGRSTARPESDPGHNVFYGYSSIGTGDAVDLKIGSGKPVYAMFNGTVEIPTWSTDKAISQCVVMKSLADKIEAWYCHVNEISTAIGLVTKGTQIATTNSIGHLHLEIWINNRSIHTTVADIRSKKYSQDGQYLWERMKYIMNFSL